MTTKRNPVSAVQNIWFDAQQVDNTDLTLEQNFNNTIESSTIDNHVGTGILPENLVQNVIFDSSLVSGFLDGLAIPPQNQPTDNNLGNQLSITLNNSAVASRRTIKLCVIGLDFESNLQYEIFYFKENETQVSQRHFASILVLLFNDFIGDPNLSFNLGGRIVIQDVAPMTLSRSTLMVAQDMQPNLFFRDFFIDGSSSLPIFLQSALPLYNVDTLNVYTSVLSNQIISSGDVTTQIGEKFIATTNNIQKVTLLLSVQNLVVGESSNLVWNGDLVVSIYPLQSSVTCAGDIAPTSPIDFAPSNIPLAQISINYNSLLSSGVVLNSVPQPVDFVFSNSPIAGGNVLVPGNYYAIALQRSGAANQCDILIAVGSNLIPNSRVTTFASTLWVDIPDQQLWFRIWTDAAKISDGQAYESGHGIIIPKTTQDPTTLNTVDYSDNNLQFTGNDVFRAVVAATTQESVPVPDQRTGNPILSRQQFVPNVTLYNTIDITNLENTAEPLIIGAITDRNIKFFNSLNSVISSNLYSATIVNDELIIKIIDDPTDTTRFDSSVISLQTNLLNGNFEGARIITNSNNANTYYRIADARLCTMIVGDVDGNGIVDINDLNILNSFLNYDLTVGPPLHSSVVTDGYTTVANNGYLTLTSPFNNLFGVQFQLINSSGNVILTGNDGVLVVNPATPAQAQFTSASIAFNEIIGISDFNLVIMDPSNDADYGIFDIIGLNSPLDVLTISKILLNGDVICQMLRADIDGDFHITLNDGYILQSYIERNTLSPAPASTYPAPSTNPYTKIGTTFNVIRFKLETFVDRTDDYNSGVVSRPLGVHPLPDIFESDGYFASHNFLASPVNFVIQEILTWDDSLVVTNSNPKLVPSVFPTQNGFIQNVCSVEGVQCSTYAAPPEFDPGRIDYFFPNNLIIGDGGELQRPDGYFYKVDFEVGTIVLQIPDGLFGSERTIDILNDFIADYTGTGVTRLGFPAMRFADCSTVSQDALVNDQLRLSVSVQSFSPNTNGLTTDGYTGVIVDGKIGVSIDYATGLLTLNFTNLYQDQVLQTLSTKVQVNVFLKKGGFNNQPIFIDSVKVQNMLQLISVFSGANEGGPSALVDLSNDISGVLPVINGGTGLNGVGVSGTVLVSNGSSLSYQFIYDTIGAIPYSLGPLSDGYIPKLDGYGLLDPSFMYKNPVYIYASAGTASNDGSTPSTIGAFTFRFDTFIMEGWSSIKLEVILETTNGSDVAQVQLFNVNTNSYLNLVGTSQLLTTTSTSAVLVRSKDLSSELSAGATDYVYEVQLSLSPTSGTDAAICKMSRLVITYNNPYGAAPPLANSSNFVPYLPPSSPG
jgi:hypothetical protein